MVVHLPSEKSILPYFSGPRGVAILDCDSHSQAGSTKLDRQVDEEDSWWEVIISDEDFVDYGCREGFCRIEKNTDDSYQDEVLPFL